MMKVLELGPISAAHLQLSPAVAAAVSQTFPFPSALVISWLSLAWKEKE